jgi:lipopolysaccharide export LptBFGC system permease protein LptF
MGTPTPTTIPNLGRLEGTARRTPTLYEIVLMIYLLLITLLAFMLKMFFNNKSFSTLMLLTEAVLFLLLACLLGLYSVTGLDYVIKTAITVIFIFSFEIALILIIIYSLSK